jgi:TRAP-type C4-dicarboxylate transport system substrate-binding protein
MKRLLLATATSVAALGMSTGFAQDRTIELKMSFWVPPSHSLVQTAQKEWGPSIEKASNGTIKVAFFPSEQLGKAADHYDMARDGIADIVYINPGYQAGRFPVIGAGELPFLIANATGGSRAIDEWYRKYAAREMKDVKFCFAFLHDPGALHLKKKVTHPDQLKGMKIRPAHATIGNYVTSLGASTVTASAPEVQQVLERGVADGVTFPWGSVFLFKFENAVKFHMDVPFYATTFAYLINPAAYSRMSASQKKVMDEHCTTEWAGKTADPWAKMEADGRARMKALPDHDVYSISAAELAAWKKAAEPLRDRWADNVKKAGLDPSAVMGELQAALKKHSAAY